MNAVEEIPVFAYRGSVMSALEGRKDDMVIHMIESPADEAGSRSLIGISCFGSAKIATCIRAAPDAYPQGVMETIRAYAGIMHKFGCSADIRIILPDGAIDEGRISKAFRDAFKATADEARNGVFIPGTNIPLRASGPETMSDSPVDGEIPGHVLEKLRRSGSDEITGGLHALLETFSPRVGHAMPVRFDPLSRSTEAVMDGAPPQRPEPDRTCLVNGPQHGSDRASSRLWLGMEVAGLLVCLVIFLYLFLLTGGDTGDIEAGSVTAETPVRVTHFFTPETDAS